MSNHKAEALRIIHDANHEVLAGRVTVAEVHAAQAAAQVHATLALVEQQRIANLIAYSNVLEENQRDGFELTDDGKAFMDRLEAQIREGLGL